MGLRPSKSDRLFYQSRAGGWGGSELPCQQAGLEICPKSIMHFVFKFNKFKINNEINQNWIKFLFVLFNQNYLCWPMEPYLWLEGKKRPNIFLTKFENSDSSGDLKQASQNMHRVTLSIKTEQVIFFRKIIFPFKLLYWKLAFF